MYLGMVLSFRRWREDPPSIVRRALLRGALETAEGWLGPASDRGLTVSEAAHLFGVLLVVFEGLFAEPRLGRLAELGQRRPHLADALEDLGCARVDLLGRHRL